jgi:outer membrane protein OmpA-like peptidoglycan-associated protein
MKSIGVFLAVCGFMAAQVPPNQVQQPNENAARMAAAEMPIYRVAMTERTAKAVDYQHRGGATKVDFRGTELLSAARGEAKVESKRGAIGIEVDFDGLQPANKFGSEYLTYVLWAITPEGRPANLGEILLNGTKSKLAVTTQLQAFALVVTAEPYYSVTRPSDLVVMENVMRADTKGMSEDVDAKYELLQRGQYQRLANPLELKLDRKLPLELYEARNAVQIARGIGADHFAAESFEKAEKNLAQAEAYQAQNAGRNPVTMAAREAVQMAEDSRVIAVKRQEEDALALERQQSVDRQARADSDRVAAQSETDRVTREAKQAQIQAQEESARLTREKDAQAASALAEADRVKRDSDLRTAALAADADRLRVENEARAAAAASDSNRLQEESARLTREKDAQAASALAEADRVKVENDARAAAAASEADRLQRQNEAQKIAMQAAVARGDQDKAELRAQLLAQFKAVLQTRDTARGLIVNMSDVLFDTGKYSLRPLAREKLAKVAGIVLGHPGLELEVEGHTDSVGGHASNQLLSEHRGTAVRDYLIQEGMAAGSVTTKGFGETQPVASNDTAQGRQQNRRVELVISGDVIGVEIGKVIAVR